MSFKVTTSIKKILNLKQRYRVIPGGTSAGKTFAIMAVLIDTAIKNPRKRIDVVSMTYNHLSAGAIADFKNIMESTNRWNPSNWHDTRHTYTFANKSYIKFTAIDSEGKARGPRRDILYVNEANKIDYETFSQLEVRTSETIYIDYNPSNRFWVDDEIIPLENSEKLVLTYRDNEGCPQANLDLFEQRRKLALTNPYYKNWCDVYLDGKIGTIEGVIFQNYNMISNIPEEYKLIGYGMDFGFTNDPTTCIAVYRQGDNIILDQLIYKRGLLAKDIASMLKENNIKGEIYADGARPEIISEIKGYGFNIQKADKGKGSILLGIDLMQEYNLFLTNRSIDLKNEFMNYSWKKNIDGSQLNEPIDSFNHAIDAIRYLFIMKLGKSRVVDPRLFQIYDKPINSNDRQNRFLERVRR